MMLGNLTVKQIEERLGVEFPDELVKLLNKTHQANANNIAIGKWHCFDMPFYMICGDEELATKIYEALKDKSADMQDQLRISIQKH